MLGSIRRALSAERIVALFLLAALVAVRIADPGAVEILRLKSFDILQQAAPRPVPADLPVVIVDIDEDSIKELGQWPWPRTLLADLVDRLAAAKARAVGFDVLFSEADRLSGASLARALGRADPEIHAILERLPSGDAIFAKSMAVMPVVLGGSGSDTPLSAGAAPLRPPQIATLGNKPEAFVNAYPGLLRPRPELAAAAAGIGLVTVLPERDGVVRRVPTVLLTENTLMPTLDLELLRAVTPGQPIIVRSDAAGIASVAVAGRVLQTDRNGQLWLNFSRHDKARFLSARDVLRGKVPADKLAGKLVLVGSSAVALFDLRTTPIDPLIPGVEIHAQVIENILAGTLLSRPNYAISVELAVLVSLGLLLILLVPIVGALPVVVLGAVLAGGFVALGWILFTRHLVLLDLSYPLAATLLVYIVLTFFNYWREEGRRTQIRSAFGQYVSPALVETLVREPDRLKLGGETRVMSVLFSDVRGFTTISESFKNDPQALVALMNGILTPLTNAILDADGTVDKYMGDAILAFWNAPLDDPEHASKACLAALDMQRRLEVYNAQRREEAQRSGQRFLPIEIGIGINTGACVVGNFGTETRFDYSAIGDSVNMASRLEALTKSYDLPILVGSETAARARQAVAILPVDRVRVKGKSEPETMHAVLGPKALETSTWFAPVADALAQMQAAYANGAWADARAGLAAAEAVDHEKRFAKLLSIYARRLDTLSALPALPEHWDGVYTFESKDG